MSNSSRSKQLFNVIATGLFITLLSLSLGSTAGTAQEANRFLPAGVAGVNVTSDTSLDFTLSTGFILSGKIQIEDGGTIVSGSVAVLSDTNASFSGLVFPETESYRIVVPTGTYQLSPFINVDRSRTITSLSVDPDERETVTVTEDTTFDLTVPMSPASSTVTGTVRRLGALPTDGTISLTSPDPSRFRASAELRQERYRARLPEGIFDVGVNLGFTNVGGFEQTFFLPVGTVIVSEARPQVFDVTVSAPLMVTGTIKYLDGLPAVPSSITFSSTSAPRSFLGRVGTVSVPEDSATGDFMLMLSPAFYSVNARIMLDLREGTTSILSLGFPNLELALATDQTHDILVPLLPPVVTLSGTVLDESGQPVPGAFVTAGTARITDMPNASFSSTTETDSNGRYELRVLSGSVYRVSVLPPFPVGDQPLAAPVDKILTNPFRHTIDSDWSQ